MREDIRKLADAAFSMRLSYEKDPVNMKILKTTA